MRRATVGSRWASFGNDDRLAIRLEREVLDDESRGIFVVVETSDEDTEMCRIKGANKVGWVAETSLLWLYIYRTTRVMLT